MKIPEIKLTPTPETEEAKSALGYKWNEGEADGISEADYPKCKDCGEKMTFYAQIDSIGDDFDLADCMVIHQFVCFDCFTVDSQLNQI